MIARLGSWCFSKKWVVIGAWLAMMVIVFSSGVALGGDKFAAGFELPSSDSRTGLDILESKFPSAGGGLSGTIVFRSENPVTDSSVQNPMTAIFDKVAKIDGVTVESPYDPMTQGSQISTEDGGRTAFANVNLDDTIGQDVSGEVGVEIGQIVGDVPGVDVQVGGAALAEFKPPSSELIGVAFAIVVLIVSFGSVLAMGLPIAVAVGGVSIGAGLIILTSHLTSIPEFATTIGAMIGLGVGIDYALFIVTRYREGLHAGMDPKQATVTALDTAGRAVVFAGLTVVISLLGMMLIGLKFVSGLGIGAAITVAVTMAASITLLPALLGLAGDRVEVTRWRGLVAAGLIAIALLGVGLKAPLAVVAVPLGVAILVLVLGFVIAPLKAAVPQRKRKPASETFAYKWSHMVQRNPLLAVIVGTAALLLLAVPMLSLQLGNSDDSNYAEDTSTRQAYDMLAEGFGPGFNGPLMVAATVDGPGDPAEVVAFADVLRSTDGVAQVIGPIPSNFDAPLESDAFLLRVIPATSPQDRRTDDLIETLRNETFPEALDGTNIDAHITGNVAIGHDFTSYLGEKMPLFLGVVLVLSFFLLMAVFRSLLVPLKAVVMNMLSIGAAYGIVVAVFQWGWGSSLLGISGAPIDPFIPMMMFAIVFGLSMDYEVFLLSRVKEEYDRTGDPRESVADGLAATARVITAAAAIMVVVFGSFVFEDNRIAKVFGLGLAVAVFLDATLVRMLLVPATMELLGEKNWWIPKWLDRILPSINVEGPAHHDDLDAEAEALVQAEQPKV